jgi:hypothetical protein
MVEQAARSGLGHVEHPLELFGPAVLRWVRYRTDSPGVHA